MKVTGVIIDKYGVHGDATLCVLIFMLGSTLLIIFVAVYRGKGFVQ